MNRRIAKLLEISVFNTIRMNFHYFGWGGDIAPPDFGGQKLKNSKIRW